MSARDDYPLGRIDFGVHGVHYTVEPGVWHDLCDELDELRAALPSKQCIPISCPEPVEIEATLHPLGYAEVCWDTDDDGECPNCVAGLSNSINPGIPRQRMRLCPKRGVFG